MAKYQQFLYDQDYYGERVRGDIPIEVIPTGYRRDPVSGRLVSKFRMTVGPLPSFPLGSRILVLASSVYYPPTPDRLNLPISSLFDRQSTVGSVSPLRELVPSAAVAAYVGNIGGPFGPEFEDDFVNWEGPYLHPGVNIVQEGWTRVLTDRDLRPVPLNSVLYLRVFVNETPPTEEAITLPWDVRGQYFSVMPGNYGGIRNAVAALPVGLLTDGAPYDVIDYTAALVKAENTTTDFVSSMGYLSDIISTDGSVMMDTVDRLHPSMVLPLLNAFGLTEDERAVMSDRFISDRGKKLLSNYRALQMSRGRLHSISEYVLTLTGYASEVTSKENLLMTLGDSTPAGPIRQNWRGWVDGTAIMVANAAYGSIPTPQGSRCLCPRRGWPGTWFDPGFTDRWHDSWIADLWLDYWGEWDNLTGDAGYEDLLVASGDPWMSEDSYQQHLDWAHRLKPGTGGGWLGTALDTEDNVDWMKSEPIGGYDDGVWSGLWGEEWEGHYFRLRCKARKIDSTAATIVPKIIFLSSDGSHLSTHTGSTVTLTEDFEVVETVVLAPEDARFVAWRLELPNADTVVSIGAIELRDMGTRTTYDEAEDFPYRNPRSLVLAMHTPYAPADDYSVLVDDETATVMDGTAIMDQGFVLGRGKIDPFTAAVTEKIRVLIRDFLPHTVSARVITGNTAEYGRIFGAELSPGSVIKPPEGGYLGDFRL